MSYQSQREKVKEWIEKNIIGKIGGRELIYQKLVSTIGAEVGVSESMVKEVLDQFFSAGKLNCFVTLPDPELLKHEKNKIEEIKQTFKEVGL